VYVCVCVCVCVCVFKCVDNFLDSTGSLHFLFKFRALQGKGGKQATSPNDLHAVPQVLPSQYVESTLSFPLDDLIIQER
jgi:hypothetical protein